MIEVGAGSQGGIIVQPLGPRRDQIGLQGRTAAGINR
jgi:hypothetical protein